MYIDIDDPYTDAFVAGLLCNGGPVKYTLQDDLIVTDNWLFVECVPSIRRRFPQDHRLCHLLGLATLYAAFEPLVSPFLDPVHADRIRSNFTRVHGEIEGNPVVKKKIYIHKTNNGRLSIVEERAPAGTAAAVPTGVPNGDGTITVSAQAFAQLQNQVEQLQQQVQGIRTEQNDSRGWLQQQFDKITRNQRQFGGTIGQALSRQDPQRQAQNRAHAGRVAEQRREEVHQQAPRQPQQAPRQQQQAPRQQQVQRLIAPTDQRNRRAGISPYAQLAPNIRSMHELWEEYMFGIGDNKPAKDFTTDEINGRGKAFALKYGRRKRIWRVQAYLINAGLNIHAANDRIKDVYGVGFTGATPRDPLKLEV